MAQSLKKRAADLERLIEERAQEVKRVLREYREAVRTGGAVSKGAASKQAPRLRNNARILKKRRDVERANAEYMALQKELDMLLSRMESRKHSSKGAVTN